MALITSLTTLATAAASLLCTPTNGRSDDPIPVVVQNQDAAITIYVGGPTVTNTGATTGIKVLAGQSIALRVMNGDSVYAIPASGTPNVVTLTGRT